MLRRSLALTLAFLGLLGPAVEAHGAPVPGEGATAPAAPNPRGAVWLEPLATAAFAVTGALDGPGGWYVPIGANLPLGSRVDLVLEATVTHGRWALCGTTWSSGFWAAVGVAVRVAGGFFVQPKLVGRYLAPVSAGCGAQPAAPSGNDAGGGAEVSVGLDVGYEFRLGRLFIAPILGASVGYCTNCPGLGGGWPFVMNGQQSGGGAVWGLNLNLLRAGITF